VSLCQQRNREPAQHISQDITTARASQRSEHYGSQGTTAVTTAQLPPHKTSDAERDTHAAISRYA